MARTATIHRKTRETEISISLKIDGTGASSITTGIGFFDHMLTLLARHGFFDLNLTCIGDTEVDYHHSVEDVGIALGQAFAEAAGDKSGISRYGMAFIPMEYSLARAVVDFSGRIALSCTLPMSTQKVGNFDTELVQEFFKAFADNARMNLHIDLLKTANAHHDIEAVFKAVARALSDACRIDERVQGPLSTKGIL
jgi:imidazoleglycerol-phosphate dehydratase